MFDLGQYIERDSLVHRLDPRVKLLTVVALSILALHTSLSGLLLIALIFLGVCAIGYISPRRLWHTTRPVWPFFIALFLIYVLFTPGTPAWFTFYSVNISYQGTLLAITQVFRFLLLVLAGLLFTMTTRHSEITMALEYLLRPLKLAGISSHNIALMVSIALRFIPTLEQEIKQISEAATARGLDLKSRGLVDRIKAMLCLVTPLTLNLMENSEELAQAMEARGYQPGDRTYLYQLSFRNKDYIALITIAVITMSIWHFAPS